jgi:hypothetical protein
MLDRLKACGFFSKRKMKTKKNLVTTFLSLVAMFSNAQTDVDAFRYSGESITGTARFTSMAGAFGALGGDFTSLSHNPAGIAIYRTSEFTFSPSMYFNSSNSVFNNSQYHSDKSNFNIGNAGLVFTHIISNNPTSDGWKSWNFGVGYNRLDNYHSRSGYEGVNQSSSMLDNFAETANGQNYDQLDPYYEYLAYATYLINPDSMNQYKSVVAAGNVIQHRNDEAYGANGETVFSFGGNYSNKLYLGATMGLQFLRYEYTSFYEEKDNNPLDTLNYWNMVENLETHGSGINFKFGMIYKPIDALRIGAAIHSPTWFVLHDDFSNNMTSKFDAGFNEHSDSPFGEYDYDYTKPFKAIGSLAYVFGKQGLISADYQYTDYGDAHFDSPGESFNGVNNTIQRKYNGVHTIRAGGELILQDVTFRGGFSMSTSPLNDAYRAGSSDFSKRSYSGGIGFRPGKLFFDIGYIYTVSDQYFQPYSLETIDVPGAKSKVVSSNVVATFGIKF